MPLAKHKNCFLLSSLLVLFPNIFLVENQLVIQNDDIALYDIGTIEYSQLEPPRSSQNLTNEEEGGFYVPGLGGGYPERGGYGYRSVLPGSGSFGPGTNWYYPGPGVGQWPGQGGPYGPYYPGGQPQPPIYYTPRPPPPSKEPTGQTYLAGSKCGVRHLQPGRLRRHLFYQLSKDDQEFETDGTGRFDETGLGNTHLLEPAGDNIESTEGVEVVSVDDETPKIVGGRVTKIQYWPWQVSLRIHGGHVCGGSILTSRFIATAAHCFCDKTSKNPADWTVYSAKSKLELGEPGEVGPIEVQSITTNPNYGRLKRFDSDIALIRLKTPLRFSDKIFPICLPGQGAAIPEGVDCFVTGYGETKGTGGEGCLKEANVPIIGQSRCSDMNASIKKRLTNNMFCAGFQQGGTDSCQGDSGGPLVCRSSKSSDLFILQGIVSFGFGCAGRSSPGVYVRVANYVNWIKETTTQQANTGRKNQQPSTPNRSPFDGQFYYGPYY